MSNIKDHDNDAPKLSRAEQIAQNRAAYLQKQKDRAKEAKKAYLAKPEVQAKLKAQKDKLKAKRKESSERLKAKKKEEKRSLHESREATRTRRQEARDAELSAMLGRASMLEDSSSKNKSTSPPTLTLIKGGRPDQP